MKKDDAVSNVIGEMLLLAIALVLVAVFAASAFSFLPGEDEDAVDISVNITENENEPNNFSILFYHKGGDWIRKDDLRCSIYRGTSPISTKDGGLTNSDDVSVSVFDLGCCLKIYALEELKIGDDIKLYTPRSVIYSGKYMGA
ncbi:MAG TPA: type IV pilin N-terminal domain-containing protein [Methanocorpusculum sp.]|nr:type IV pilin N-terminal domain-containing protein [Methanocorpusculum sp.]